MSEAETRPGATYEYWQLDDVEVIARRGGAGDAILTETGWQLDRRFNSRLSSTPGLKTEQEVARLARRCRQRLNNEPLDAPAEAPPRRSALMAFKRWLVPPLQYGAPMRLVSTARQDDAEEAYLDELPSGLTSDALDELIEQARDGYERQGERTLGFERRAGLFQNTASLSGGLVLAGSTLLVGDQPRPEGATRWIVLAGLIGLTVALLLSGFRACQITLYTLSWARPNIRRNIKARAELRDPCRIKLSLLAALLLAQDRGQTLAEWKLARLKQATWWFGVAVGMSVVVSVAYVVAIF